jgi:hypothetical protein
METILWIAIACACFFAVWWTAPYHQRLIDSRPRITEHRDEV